MEVANTSSIWNRCSETLTPNEDETLRPPGSRAVTVTVAMPPASALTTTELPDTSARATPAFDEDAV